MFRKNTPGWDIYCKTGAQPFNEFLNLVHGCSPDPVTRSMAVLSVVTAVWQHLGTSVPFGAPSQILIHTRGDGIDPIERLTRTVNGREERVSEDDLPLDERTREWMKNLIRSRNKEGEVSLEYSIRRGRSVCTIFDKQRMKSFGNGSVGGYAERMDVDFGCVTNHTDEVVLRIDEEKDYKMFRRDLLTHGGDFFKPLGYDHRLEVVKKTIHIQGAITPKQWGGAITTKVVEDGLPILFSPLPMGSAFKLSAENKKNLGIIAGFLATEGLKGYPTLEPRQRVKFPDEDGFEQCGNSLRGRLRYFPGEYEFFVLSLIRELRWVCLLISMYLSQDGTAVEKVEPLARDLHLMCLVAITHGVRCLGYHGLGVETGGRGLQVSRVLAMTRKTGSISRRSILRQCQTLDAAERDKILDLLVSQGLVQIDGRNVIAVPLSDFVAAAGRSPEFRNMKLLSAP